MPAVATAGVVGILALSVTRDPSVIMLILTASTPPLTALVITSVARGRYFGWLSWSPLRYVGQRSYALYLWNYLCLWVCWQLDVPVLVQNMFGVALALLIAEVSWRCVERPAAGWLRRQRTSPASTVPELSTITAAP